MIRVASIDSWSLELGAVSSSQRDWRGVLISLATIMMIWIVIIGLGYAITPAESHENDTDSHVSLTTLWEFRARNSLIQWIDDETVIVSRNGNFFTHKLSGEESDLLSQTRINDLVGSTATATFSADLQYAVLQKRADNPTGNPEQRTSIIYLVDLQTNKTRFVTAHAKHESSDSLWNTKGHDMIFIQDGVIYYDSPELHSSIQVSDSDPTKVHGWFDWMYSEEIQPDKKAAWWSDSGRYLAFGTRNKDVGRNITMTRYTNQDIYPIYSNIGYPKVGETLMPIYNISIWDKTSGESPKIMKVQLPDPSEFVYMYAVQWIEVDGKDRLIVVWTPRFQNRAYFTMCEYKIGSCKMMADFIYPEKTWALGSDFVPLKFTNDSIYVLLPKMGPDGGFQHIARIEIQPMTSNRLSVPQFLTLGAYDVRSIVAIDSDNQILYFTAFSPSPRHINLYSLSLAQSAVESVCMTCGFDETYFSTVLISPDFGHVWLTSEGPEPVTRHRLFQLEQNKLILMDEILELEQKKAWDSIRPPALIKETIPLKEDYEAEITLFMPPGLNPRGLSRSLPVLLKVYGGPGSQSVCDRAEMAFEQMLVMNHGIAVLKVDARGAASRGWKYKSPVYGALGTVEIEDQIEAVKQVIARYPMLDRKRVSVFGWSYGGYASAHIVEQSEPGFIKCSVSVAPVSNFKYYDAAYTERYMGNASDGAYDRGDISVNVSNFNRTRLLLMHGLFDDNVHFQNSAMFMAKLQGAGIDFDLMVYPNQAHGIEDYRKHLFTKIEKFLTTCLEVY